MDDIDTKIIQEISLDSTKKIAHLAKKLGFPRSTIHNRIKRLEKDGVILGYRAIINHEKVKLGETAFVNINVTDNKQTGMVVSRLLNDPRVADVYTVTGQTDVIAKVRFNHTRDVAAFLYSTKGDSPRSITGVHRTETWIVLQTFKEDGIARELSYEDNYGGKLLKAKPHAKSQRF
ncbi:MAG: Lrp/AsnC family transcriptional regulator [Nanoarchaeota archaeon]